MKPLETIRALQESYQKIIVAKELYDSLLSQIASAKNHKEAEKIRLRIRFAREDMLRQSLAAKKLIGTLSRHYAKG